MVSSRLNGATLRRAMTTMAMLPALSGSIAAMAEKPSVQVQFEVGVPSFATLPESRPCNRTSEIGCPGNSRADWDLPLVGCRHRLKVPRN